MMQGCLSKTMERNWASFHHPPPTLKCLFFPPSSSSSILCIRPHPCNWNVHFHFSRPLQPTNAYLAHTGSSLRTWKRLSLSTVPLLQLNLSFPSLLSWFPLRFHHASSDLSSDLSLCVLIIYRWKEEQEWHFSWRWHVYSTSCSLALRNGRKFFSNIRNCEWKEIVEMR